MNFLRKFVCTASILHNDPKKTFLPTNECKANDVFIVIEKTEHRSYDEIFYKIFTSRGIFFVSNWYIAHHSVLV